MHTASQPTARHLVKAQTLPRRPERRDASPVFEILATKEIHQHAFLRPDAAKYHQDGAEHAPGDHPIQGRQQGADGGPKESGVYWVSRKTKGSVSDKLMPRLLLGFGGPVLSHIDVRSEEEQDAGKQRDRPEQLDHGDVHMHPATPTERPSQTGSGKPKEVEHERAQKCPIFAFISSHMPPSPCLIPFCGAGLVLGHRMAYGGQ